MRKFTLPCLAFLAALLLGPLQIGPSVAATLTVTDTTEGGIQLSTTMVSAASAGDELPNDSSGRTLACVTNGAGSSMTVTVTPATTSISVPGRGTLTKSNGGGTVTNGTTKCFGPFPTLYNNSSGRVAFTYSTNTSVTIGGFRVPQP
jgi:hypothetical protein